MATWQLPLNAVVADVVTNVVAICLLVLSSGCSKLELAQALWQCIIYSTCQIHFHCVCLSLCPHVVRILSALYLPQYFKKSEVLLIFLAYAWLHTFCAGFFWMSNYIRIFRDNYSCLHCNVCWMWSIHFRFGTPHPWYDGVSGISFCSPLLCWFCDYVMGMLKLVTDLNFDSSTLYFLILNFDFVIV